MKAKIDYTHKRGLPGGPNEQFTYVTGIFSVNGYRDDSPDVNNPFNVIPSGRISMREHDGTPLKKGPILGIDNLGNKKVMFPGNEYQFPGDEVFETPLEQFPDGGTIYTYPGRPGSYYKKDGDKWLISNANTGGKYIPIDDPDGKRTANLNKGAVVALANPTVTQKQKMDALLPSYNNSPMVMSVKGRTQNERAIVDNDIQTQATLTSMQEAMDKKTNMFPQHEQPLDMMDGFWQAAAGLPTGLKALGQIAALQIPYLGVSVGTAANTIGAIHGATQIPSRVKDWQDVSAGKKTWQEATFNTLGTGLEVGAGLYEALPAAYKIGKDIYDAGKGSNLFFNTSAEAQVARNLQDAGLLGKNVDPKVFGQYPYLAQNATKRILKDYNTTYRAVTPNVENLGLEELMNMAKAGVHVDDPIQVSQYMSTHVPTQEFAHRANPLVPGAGQDLLYTAKYANSEEAARKLKQYGNYMTEVRPKMDFSSGTPAEWFRKYYTEKPFGKMTDPDLPNPYKNEGGWLTGYKSGTIAGFRDSEYWPYMGQRGEKLLEAVKTIKLEKDGGSLEQYPGGGDLRKGIEKGSVYASGFYTDPLTGSYVPSANIGFQTALIGRKPKSGWTLGAQVGLPYEKFDENSVDLNAGYNDMLPDIYGKLPITAGLSASYLGTVNNYGGQGRGYIDMKADYNPHSGLGVSMLGGPQFHFGNAYRRSGELRPGKAYGTVTPFGGFALNTRPALEEGEIKNTSGITYGVKAEAEWKPELFRKVPISIYGKGMFSASPGFGKKDDVIGDITVFDDDTGGTTVVQGDSTNSLSARYGVSGEVGIRIPVQKIKQNMPSVNIANLNLPKINKPDIDMPEVSSEEIQIEGDINGGYLGRRVNASTPEGKEIFVGGSKSSIPKTIPIEIPKEEKQEGGELDLYKKYINGEFDGTPEELEAKKIYDKLNRVYYKSAKEAGMSVPNYIMSNVLTL